MNLNIAVDDSKDNQSDFTASDDETNYNAPHEKESNSSDEIFADDSSVDGQLASLFVNRITNLLKCSDKTKSDEDLSRKSFSPIQSSSLVRVCLSPDPESATIASRANAREKESLRARIRILEHENEILKEEKREMVIFKRNINCKVLKLYNIFRNFKSGARMTSILN